jgi:hypothetical protein
MLYQKRSFTVPATASNPSMCLEKGHSATDSRGRCFCCGEKIRESIAETSESFVNRGRRMGAIEARCTDYEGPRDESTWDPDHSTFP